MLSIGDSLLLIGGDYLEVQSVGIIQGKRKVHNLVVQDFHTYYVSSVGVLVHNGVPCFTFRNVNLKEIKEFVSTEVNAQGAKAREAIQKALREGDPFIFSDPIDVVTVKGKTYILDGHNRLEAIKDMGYEGQVTVRELSQGKAKEMYGSKMEEILRGDH
jgi:hypothetical protein